MVKICALLAVGTMLKQPEEEPQCLKGLTTIYDKVLRPCHTLSQCNCNPSLVITTTKNFCCRDLHHYRTSNRVSVCPPFCFRLLLFVTSVPRGHRRGGDRGGHCPSVARGRSCGGTARKGLFCLLGNDNFRSHDSCLGKESQS